MYRLGIAVYSWIFRFVALFHKKANKMVTGHKETWRILSRQVDHKRPWLWFHAASLGEFEQGRPIMERIRKEHPEYAILLTFYSPSGYDVRKDYSGADVVCYLPFDRKKNVQRFLNIVRPASAFFIKYEFWPNYLAALYKRKIPTYLVSGIFREDQAFFKTLAAPYRNILRYFTHFFVQDENSVRLLASIGYSDNVTISGDTRFDRVLEIRKGAKQLDIIESFIQKSRSGNGTILITGSSWPKDEALYIPYFNEHPELRLIIAPHEINEEHLNSIEAQLTRPFCRYSATTAEEAGRYDCIIIDCFGLLSSIYRYGDIAYIGGGFGAGIHNTLEAAVYGIPVIFGPNYEKFAEAKALLQCGGGITIQTKEEVESVLERLLTEKAFCLSTGKKAGELVKNGSGGTDIILRHLFK